MATYDIIVWGVRVYMADHMAPLTADATIGLYNVNSALASNATSGQKDVILSSGGGANFAVGQAVKISDTAGSEENVIASIASNTLTMLNDLANAYTTARTAKVYGDSQLRYLQNALSGVDNWNATLLRKGGISKLAKTVDLTYGGNVAFPGGFSFSLVNTAKLYKSFSDLSAYITGKKAEPVYFINTTCYTMRGGICQQPSWSATEYNINVTGEALKRNTVLTQEVAVTGTTDRVVIPATFGQWLDSPAKAIRKDNYSKIYNGNDIAKLVSDYDGTDVSFNDTFPVLYSQYYRYTYTSGSGTFIDGESCTIVGVGFSEEGYICNRIGTTTGTIDLFNNSAAPFEFPAHALVITGTFSGATVTIQSNAYTIIATPYYYIIRTTGTALWKGGGTLINLGTDLYMNVVSGNGSGYYRPISYIYSNGYSEYVIKITKCFQSNLIPYPTTDYSWINIVECSHKYSIDTDKCLGFYDDSNTVTDTDITCYSYKENFKGTVQNDFVSLYKDPIGYVRLLRYAFIRNTSQTDQNELMGKPENFLNDLNTVDSYLLLPVIAPSRYSPVSYNLSDVASDLTPFKKSEHGGFFGYDAAEGFSLEDYSYDDHSGTGAISRDPTLASSIDIYVEHSGIYTEYAHVLYWTMPDLPTGYDDFELYFGIRSSTYIQYDAYATPKPTIRLYTKRLYISTKIFENSTLTDYSATRNIDNIPRFYYGQFDQTDENFYKESSDTTTLLSGYTFFPIAGITKHSLYHSIERMYYVQILPGNAAKSTLHFYELCIMLKKTNDVSSEVYTKCGGRVFNSTWGRGKTSTDMMTSPIDIMENVCRLQNWSEYTLPPTGGWGAAYSDGARIKTSGTGSFDDTGLNTVKAFSAANQLLSVDDGDTDVIKKSLCQNFLLCNYIDNNGYECVVPLTKTAASPTNTITLSDIRYANSKIEIREYDPMKIFPEFVVRYNLNTGSGKYESLIRLKNVTDDPDNVTTGTVSDYFEDTDECFSGNEAVELWKAGHALWLLTGHLTPVPAAVSDIAWANGTTVNAKAIAKWYFEAMLGTTGGTATPPTNGWMSGRYVNFSVHFMHTSSGVNTRDWCEGQRFILQLPHETNNGAIECIATKIEINPYSPYLIDIEAIMLSSSTPGAYFIQDVMYTQAEGAGADWVDNMTEYGTSADKIDQM